MFKKLGALFVVCVLTALPAFAAETYQIDKNHSEIGFQIRHVLTKVRGAFTDFEGTIRLDRETPENSSVNVTIQAASIDTNNPRRDQDLQSDNFFDVENYPEITFESSKVVKTGENTYDVTGTFTMHGVSKEITLPATFLGTMKDARGTTKAGFEASTTIDRKHWGIVYNRAVEGGGLLLGDDVEIDINIEANEASTVSGQPGGGQDRAARGGGGGGPGGGGFLAQFDADGDGKISKEEAPERMQERFDTMDANGDGFIDQEEMQAMRQRLGGRGGPGGGRRPPQ